MNRQPLLTSSFVRLWLFSFITFFSAFQLFPAIPLHILELGGSKSQAGLFLAIYTYACAISAPLTGTLADRFGRKRSLMIASASFILFSLLYGVVRSWPLLLVVGCLHGVCWSAILSSSSAISSELIPASRRVEGLAWWGMASTAAIAVAPFVGLLVFKHGWLTLCIEMALLSCLMVALAGNVRESGEARKSELPRLSQLIDWRIVLVAVTLFVVSFGYGGVTSYVALLSDERHIEPRSLFFTIFAVTILVTRLLTARIGDRHGPLVLLYPALALVPFALALLAFSTSRSMLITAGILYGAGFGSAYPGFMTYVLAHTDPARRAATFGSVIWAFDTGIGTGSLFVGRLVESRGYTTAFLAAAALSIFSIPIFLLTSRRLTAHRAASLSATVIAEK